jgi:hypothetical protein
MMEGQRDARPIPEATNHVPRLSSMPRKPCRHRRRCHRDRGQRRRRLTNGMKEDAARKEDNTTTKMESGGAKFVNRGRRQMGGLWGPPPPPPDHETTTLAAMAAAPPSALSSSLAPTSLILAPPPRRTTTTKRCDGPCGLTKDESGYSITMWSRGANRRWTCLVCSRRRGRGWGRSRLRGREEVSGGVVARSSTSSCPGRPQQGGSDEAR